jgi:hypothetical protein
MGGRGGAGAAGSKNSNKNAAAQKKNEIDAGDYGNVKTIANTPENKSKYRNSYVSPYDQSKIVVVTNVTTGVSDKQIAYAQSVKNRAMRIVDDYPSIVKFAGDYNDDLKFRNSLMEKINNETSARTILDNLKDKGVKGLAKYYNITVPE